jgi:hypothetical protein
MMEMFVRRAAPKAKASPTPVIEEEEKPSEAPAATVVCFPCSFFLCPNCYAFNLTTLLTSVRMWQLKVNVGFVQAVEVLDGVKHISEALQCSEEVDVVSDWKALLCGRWKHLGETMKNSRVPGLPPPFARRSNAPRDPAKFAAMVLQSSDWQGVRTWRRKLFHYPADGNRPPFYGSFSRRRCAI